MRGFYQQIEGKDIETVRNNLRGKIEDLLKTGYNAIQSATWPGASLRPDFDKVNDVNCEKIVEDLIRNSPQQALTGVSIKRDLTQDAYRIYARSTVSWGGEYGGNEYKPGGSAPHGRLYRFGKKPLERFEVSETKIGKWVDRVMDKIVGNLFDNLNY